jgi:hypothetical protein
MGAFCVGWNLLDGDGESRNENRESRIGDGDPTTASQVRDAGLPLADQESVPDPGLPLTDHESSFTNHDSRLTTVDSRHTSLFDQRFLAGVLAALLMVVLGNLGTVRMVYQGLERLGAPGGNIDTGNIGQRFVWAVESMKLIPTANASSRQERAFSASTPTP